VEAEAPPLLKPRTYLEPFGLRALGIVREDEALVEQAQSRFRDGPPLAGGADGGAYTRGASWL